MRNHRGDQRIDERCFAGTRAADDEDIFIGFDGVCQVCVVRWRQNVLLDVIPESVISGMQN